MNVVPACNGRPAIVFCCWCFFLSNSLSCLIYRRSLGRWSPKFAACSVVTQISKCRSEIWSPLPPKLNMVDKNTLLLISTQNVWFDLLMLMANKQSYVTVMINKRRYSSDITVFDMSTVILHNSFKTTTPLVDATVSETLSYFLPLGDWLSLSSVIPPC